MSTPLRIATAATAIDGDHVLDLDAAHWASQGNLRFDVELDQTGQIVASDLIAGFMHRGAEKLFEVRDYRQGLALANRHDWLAPVCGEIVFARAAEELLGMSVPEQARQIRVLLIEVSRAAALMTFLGAGATPLGLPAGELALVHRDRLLTLIEQLTGLRMHLTFTAIGGVREPVPPAWCSAIVAEADQLEIDVLAPLEIAVTSEVFRDLAQAVGTVSTNDAASFGASGIIGRASAIELDVRRDDADYAQWLDLLPSRLPTTGDVFARVNHLVAELRTCLEIVRQTAQLVAAHPDAVVNIALPKVLRVPVGTSLQFIETPLGASGVLLESRGDRAPARLALRTPSFAHAPLLAKTLISHRLDQVPMIVSSWPLVVGDLDK